MVTPDEPGREPIDPVYAALFRPEDLEDQGEPVDDEPDHDEPDHDEPDQAVDAPAVDTPAVDTPAVDTGRLFRSQGVLDDEGAVLALASDHGGRLRSLARDLGDRSGPDRIDAVADPGTGDPATPDGAPAKETRADRRRRQSSARPGHRASGIAAGAVYIIVIGLTLVVGFVNAWLGGGELGWPTGIALLVSTVYCALRVRRDDDIVAVITPPIAFFLTAITAGQAFRGASGGGLVNRAQLVFFTLAYNWYWVIGTTIVAVVIVLVRRRR